MQKFNSDTKMGTDFLLVDIEAIQPYKRNARKHSKQQIKKIADSIKQFGFISPCIIDGENNLIAGHGRVEGARILGMKQVPCVRVEHLSEQEKRAYILADNRLAELSDWDMHIVELELSDLTNLDFDLKITGFDIDDIKENNENNGYTQKIEAPLYEPKGEKPLETQLFDAKKTETLLEEIKSLEAPEVVKTFLALAAHRHTVFDYSQIAEYYCHAPKNVQELMEKSALVIIDFDKAIENGFVRLSKDLAGAYTDEV